MTLYDKNKRPIYVGDTLKVFHFQGVRWNKKHYMYKYVYDKVTYPAGHTLYHILHLSSNPKELLESKYYLLDEDGKVLEDYEVVQGYRNLPTNEKDSRGKIIYQFECLEDRQKLKLSEVQNV